MKDGLSYLLNLVSYGNHNYLLTDLLFLTNYICFICFLGFFFCYRQPFFLILFLEIIYLCININFSILWLLNNFTFGLSYVLIILGISTAETVVGLVIIISLSQATWLEAVKNSQLK